MKVGDLVKEIETGHMAIVYGVDKEYYGARQAYKIVGYPPGTTLHPRLVNAIRPTKNGINDRVLILWTSKTYGREYIPSNRLEVISESR